MNFKSYFIQNKVLYQKETFPKRKKPFVKVTKE